MSAVRKASLSAEEASHHRDVSRSGFSVWICGGLGGRARETPGQ